ncbi:PREDICTED: GDSL esterase/lipase 5-like [Nelumbo nucifera]|uniref:GDSL esterase/lipase 5-like n=1 Tax=Nelumbo nucifera TaxID=4432 RepID=A0A1U8BBR9_NELNU|nr:PREDICTED: GDSL esterase/lipase 5-like [Nelumbo nucifera]
MATLTILRYSLVFYAALLIIPTVCSLGYDLGKPKNRVPFFIFGDSLVDAGNNNYINTSTLFQANFWPYGETSFQYPSGRFSDGRLSPDIIAEYANIPFIPPFLHPGVHRFSDGANFASVGAGALVETFRGLVINLNTQLSYFKKVAIGLREELGDGEAEKLFSRAVYLISIGGNDYMFPFLNNSSIPESSQAQYVGTVIGNLSSVIQEIYKIGGRKFGLIRMSPLGCVPGVRITKPENKGACLQEALTLAELHNKALSELLRKLEIQLPEFKYSNYDFYTFIDQRMKYPSKYGFKEGENACCGTGPFRGVPSCGGRRTVKEYQLCDNPNDYVFWDAFHLTDKAYQQMAEQMWSGTSPVVEGNYNMKSFFECVAP